MLCRYIRSRLVGGSRRLCLQHSNSSSHFPTKWSTDLLSQYIANTLIDISLSYVRVSMIATRVCFFVSLYISVSVAYFCACLILVHVITFVSVVFLLL